MKREIKKEFEIWFAGAFDGMKSIAFTLNFRQRQPGKWLPDDLTGASVYHESERLTEQQALATYKRWYNGLCRKALGAKAVARKNRAKLQHLVVKEGKVSRHDQTVKQFHLHGVIEVPKGIRADHWVEMCEAEWVSLPWADPMNHDFTKYRDAGCIEYILKDRTKEDVEDSILLEITHLNDDVMRRLKSPAPSSLI
ncbi:hypothetical protein [Diaphorobacter aerolatus]|uniref:Uncharacterized protein n=1 Tax=Diaphorobacter aerolatus TaxID=1288495 RepID=A0A7H0GPV9_9BURK|nr:hypothetical protein [Diaphorobacter aerolatus]QNP50325.1 hypothetical protein H9K75_11450 [Diaphorobacter aerolatus]